MRQICGIKIQRFIYIDIVVVWFALPYVIVQMLTGDKLPGFGGNLSYFIYRIAALISFGFAIPGGIFLIWCFKKKQEWRLKYYPKFRFLVFLLCYLPLFWHYISVVLPASEFTLGYKVLKVFSFSLGATSAVSHVWAVHLYLRDYNAYGGAAMDRTQNHNNTKNEFTCDDFMENLTDQDKSFLTSIKIPKARVRPDFGNLLGTGQFGKVVKGELKSEKNVDVAIKFVKYSTDQAFLSSIISELKTLVRAGNHPNIVSVYGVTVLELCMGIILELCHGGNLLSFLIKKRKTLGEGDSLDKKQDIVELVKFAQQIALGMDYLASKQIVHGDLSARNILLTEDNVIKINDFGMSLHLYNYQLYATSNQTIFPWRWMPPESLVDLKFSTQSDVWSFGVVLWEIFTLGQTPFAELGWDSSFAENLKNDLRLEKPVYATPEMYDLMKRCWHLEQSLRVSFGKSVTELNAMLSGLER